MNILSNSQFAFLTSNPKTFYKIVEHENEWFYTIDIYNTEHSSGIGIDKVRIIKQTWELMNYLPPSQNNDGHFHFKMWGEEPSRYNNFTNTLQHEGKSIFALENEVIFRLNMLILQSITQNSFSDFTLNNYRNCQGIRNIYSQYSELPKDILDNIMTFEGQPALFEILVHPAFKFPENTIANNFSKTSVINKETLTGQILSKKMFFGTIHVTGNQFQIQNTGSNSNLPDKNYVITIKICKAGYHFKFISNESNYQTEFIIDSFSFIPK